MLGEFVMKTKSIGIGPSILFYAFDNVSRLLFPFMLMLFVLVYIVATIPVWANKYRW